MSQPKPPPQPSSLNLQDILYVLFRHKWKIIICATIGICAAAAVFLLYPTVYESQAKLLVRYVVDTSAIDQVESRSTTGPASENLINSEVEILTSSDLAMQVASAVGFDRLIPASEGVPDIAKAINNLRLGLAVTALRGTNIILVSYRNRNPELSTLVLKELVNRYFIKHLEVHRSADAFNFVSQQSDQVRAQLGQTEGELKRLKEKVGIVSLEESTKSLNAELARTRETLKASEAEQAERQAVLREMEKPLPGQEQKAQDVTTLANSDIVQQYQTIVARLATLRESDLELVSRYAQKTEQPEVLDEQERKREMRRQRDQSAAAAPQAGTTRTLWRRGFVGAERDEAQALARERYRRQNDSGFSYQGGKKSFDTLVKEAEQDIIKQKIDKALIYKASDDELLRLSQLQTLNQLQIDNLEKQRGDLELKYPGLAAALPNTSAEELQAEASAQRARSTLLAGERARLAGIDARTEALASHLSDLQGQTQQLYALAPQIKELERSRDIEENNYKYFQASLEKARVDEALDPSKMPNISVVQSPSIATKTSREVKKLVLGLAGGGIALGFAFAFLIDFVLNRTVKRPLEIEMLLGMPPMLSIPYVNGRNRWRLPLPGRGPLTLQRTQSPAPWESGHFVRTFAEAIRDRLILYFLLNQLGHKPKLVAVTGCSEGAGASTVAAGLAAALSETGDGKVLIVDMNIRGPEVHPFFRGAPACSLTEALVGAPSPAGENLYLAVAASPEAPDAQIIPKRFYDLVPHLKASDFDYIIFDMPPLSQTSITLSIAGLMDKVLVIVEGEKSNRDFLKRTYAELIACRATVSIIFNKARSYTPEWLAAVG